MNCSMCHKHHAVISVGDDGDMICTKCADKLVEKTVHRFWLIASAWIGITLGTAIGIVLVLLLKG